MPPPVRLGILVPPGNPTVEPELYRMVVRAEWRPSSAATRAGHGETPRDVSIHFSRLDAPPSTGTTGAADFMEERTRAYLASLAGPARSLAAVNPTVVLLAHTASSYVVGHGNEQGLVDRLAALTRTTATTAARAVLAALQHLGVKRLALATPYPASISALGKTYWQAAGLDVVNHHRLDDVRNIYEETETRAYDLARAVDVADADGVLISGTGLPTVGAIEALERDLGKPVVTSNQASLWHALRLAGVRATIPGFGRLLREE